MRIYDIIEKKRSGEKLTREEISYFVKGVVNGTIDDCAIGSFLMAVCEKSMTMEEIYNLTMAMASSGKMMNLSEIKGAIADKHSSGGVSDSTTLIVTAILACLGVKVAKMSGRGLGHTGGTIDKLESFDGYQTDLSMKEFTDMVNRVGASIAAQTQELVPADKKLYAIRDISATVSSIPLIASSIMSKKLASGVGNILLDVKYGKGAFMEDPLAAVNLAEVMVKIGTLAGRNVTAFISSMQQPLGCNIGCNLEMREVIEVLSGKDGDLSRLSKRICQQLLLMTGTASSQQAAVSMVDEALKSGKAFQKLKEIISAHGGNTDCFDDLSVLETAPAVKDIYLERSGEITAIDTKLLGETVCDLGGGRRKKDDQVDHTVGMTINVRLGDTVDKNQPVAKIFASSNEQLAAAEKSVKQAFTVDGEKSAAPLIFAVVTAKGTKYNGEVQSIVTRRKSMMEYKEQLDRDSKQYIFKNVVSNIEYMMYSQLATKETVEKHCKEAEDNNFAAVNLLPTQVAAAKKFLTQETTVKVNTVVGFPYGEQQTAVKVLETKQAVKDGADEIDVVMCMSKAKQGDFKYVAKELTKVVKAAKGHAVKVIIECTLLTPAEITQAVNAAVNAKAAYICTSTGVFGNGATVEHVRQISEELKKTGIAAKEVKIKATGDIRSMEDVYALSNAGAIRIGTESALQIVSELRENLEKEVEREQKASDLQNNKIQDDMTAKRQEESKTEKPAEANEVATDTVPEESTPAEQ